MSAPELADLAWIDLVGLALLALLTLLGAIRGLWWQVIRLVGLAGAVFLARALAPRWSQALAEADAELPPLFVHGTVWLLVFLAGLGVAALLGRLGRRMLEALQLGLLDRTLGAAAGAATAILAHAVVLVCLVQLAPSEIASESLAGSKSRFLLDSLAQRWPVLVDGARGEEIEARLGERGAGPSDS